MRTTINASRAKPSPVPGLYADPSLAVFDGRFWLYPTTDGTDGWQATAFEAFSSPDLSAWTAHGEVLRLGRDVRWAADRAWAPAIAERDGAYFLYFTAGGGSIGVARAEHPAGLFLDAGAPLIAPGDFSGVAIDPSVFRDDDGTWYLLWGNGVAHIVPLNDDLMSFDPGRVIEWVPTGFREAVSVHRSGDTYYASWSENDTRDPDYGVRYATSKNLVGPWHDRGPLITAEPDRGYLGTGHHTVLRIPGTDEWVVAYHRFALENGNGHRREIVFDRLMHHADGGLEVIRDSSGLRRPLAADHCQPAAARLTVRARRPGDNGDPATLTGAVHLDLQRDGHRLALRSGGGVVYAMSETLPDGRQLPGTLRDPLLLRQEERYLLVAIPQTADGTDHDGPDLLLIAESDDPTAFEPLTAIGLGSSGGVENPRLGHGPSGNAVITWTAHDGATASRELIKRGAWKAQPTAHVVQETVPTQLDPKTADRLVETLGEVRNVAVELDVPGGDITPENLHAIRARLLYNDGSARLSCIEWDTNDAAALHRPGVHTVRGRIPVLDLPFPFIADKADPVIFRNDGRWHLVATDEIPRGDDYGLLIRSAECLEDLANAADVKILGSGIAGIEGCFWAPEVHDIGGALRMLFAPSVGTPDWTGVQCHIMTLREGGDPALAADWSEPEPVLANDGEPLQLAGDNPGISLDMTYFQAGGRSYYVWSQRVIDGQHVGDAELWIAEVDPARPERLAGEPRLLHTGRRSWELTGTNVVEGPYALQRDGMVHLAYAAAAVGPDYATGFLRAPADADLLDASVWTVQPYPALDSGTVPGQRGPGHVSFVQDGDTTLVAFHAKRHRDSPSRDTGIRRVHWRANGTPDLGMTAERDVAPHLRDVLVTVAVTEEAP